MNQSLSTAAKANRTEWKSGRMCNQNYFVENLFSLAITQKQTRTKITMDLLYSHINTNKIPFISDLLMKNLPSVLESTCYNDLNLPFVKEVRNTEIGHLFEHIVLEYLCQNRLAKGAKKATYTGRTNWNWTRDPFGRFHIQLNCGIKDADILPLALDQSISLMKIILDNSAEPLFLVESKMNSRNGLKNGERRW